MVVPAVFGGALLVAFVILVAIIAKASGHGRRRYSGADGGSSFAAFSDGGSDGCDSGSSADGGCGDGGGGDGGGGSD